MSDDFKIPAELSEGGKKAAEAIRQLLGPHAYGGGCRAFYSPEEWHDRGERYGCESVLVLCHDGGDLARFCNYDYQDYDAVEKMSDALKGLGFYVESCTSWYSAVYPI